MLTNADIDTHMHTHICMQPSTHTHTHPCTHKHMHMHTFLHTCMPTFFQQKHPLTLNPTPHLAAPKALPVCGRLLCTRLLILGLLVSSSKLRIQLVVGILWTGGGEVSGFSYRQHPKP